jgi:ATPase subunit of ABC transporter with duplicated ATPase domains
VNGTGWWAPTAQARPHSSTSSAATRNPRLDQDQFIYENEEILGVTLQGNPDLWQAMVAKEELLAETHGEFDAERFSELEEIIQRHDGYAAEARAAEILEGLGFPTSVHRQPMSTLSS